MKNDTLIRIEGMEALMDKLGLVEAERFIMLLKREPFDYTEWRKNQFNGKNIEAIFAEAAVLRTEADSRKKKKAAQPRKPKADKKSRKGQKSSSVYTGSRRLV